MGRTSITTSTVAGSSKEMDREEPSQRMEDILNRLGYQGPSSYSIDLIHKLVSVKQSHDIQSLMRHQFGHSLQYLVMTLFSHDAILQNGISHFIYLFINLSMCMKLIETY